MSNETNFDKWARLFEKSTFWWRGGDVEINKKTFKGEVRDPSNNRASDGDYYKAFSGFLVSELVLSQQYRDEVIVENRRLKEE